MQKNPLWWQTAFIHQTLPKNSHWAQKRFSEFDSKTMLSILSPHCTLYFLPFHLLGARTALSEGKSTVLCGTPPKTVVVLCSTRRIRRLWLKGDQDQKRELPSVHLLNCRGCCWNLRRAWSNPMVKVVQFLCTVKYLWGCVLDEGTTPCLEFLNLNSWTYIPEGEENFYWLKIMGFLSYVLALAMLCPKNWS